MTNEDPDSLPVPALSDILGRLGPFACTRCKAQIDHPLGVCEECSVALDREKADKVFPDLMRAARESIPERYRWAEFGTALLLERCQGAAIRAVLALPSPLPVGVALVGPRDTGKSSLACAMLRRMHDWARPDRPHALVERARRAYFVSAPELVAAGRPYSPNEEQQALIRRARSATILVLDNVEPGSINDEVGRVVLERHNREQPTIITTWMSQDEAGKYYGGGWAKRAYLVTVEAK